MRIAPVATDCAVTAAACAAALMFFGLGTFWLVMRTTMTHNVPTVCHFRRPGATRCKRHCDGTSRGRRGRTGARRDALMARCAGFHCLLGREHLSARPNERVTWVW